MDYDNGEKFNPKLDHRGKEDVVSVQFPEGSVYVDTDVYGDPRLCYQHTGGNIVEDNSYAAQWLLKQEVNEETVAAYGQEALGMTPEFGTTPHPSAATAVWVDEIVNSLSDTSVQMIPSTKNKYHVHPLASDNNMVR